MYQTTFDRLIKESKCDSYDLMGAIGFSKATDYYSVNFYGELENNFDLVVEEFAYKIDNRWISVTPTADQIEMMKDKLTEKILDLKRESGRDKAVQDNYESCGHKISDFITH